MKRKSQNQYLYATESVSKFDYRTAKSFFRDVKKDIKKQKNVEKGIKQRITRTEKLLKSAVGFKGSKKEVQKMRNKFLKSFEGLANKTYLEYNKELNSLRSRHIVKREFYNGKMMFSRTKKFKVGKKTSYKFSGDVYDYDSFKKSLDNYDSYEREKILHYKDAFASGKYARWSVAIKTALGIDRSVSDASLLKWLNWYERGK